MALTKEERQKLDETHDSVLKLEVVLLGKNGYDGIVGQVQENTKRSIRNTIILASFFGLGTLGGSAFGIVRFLL